MDPVNRIMQLMSDDMEACQVCGQTDLMGMTSLTNHIIEEHGWRVLHVGQDTGTLHSTGELYQRTTVVLGEPE